MDLYNLSAKYAGLFLIHFTVRETRTRELRSIKTKGEAFPNLHSAFCEGVLEGCNSGPANSEDVEDLHSQRRAVNWCLRAQQYFLYAFNAS